MNALLSAGLALGLLAAPASADLIKDLSSSSVYDDNVFGTSTGGSDVISQVSAYVANRFANPGSATRIFYSGSGYLFARSPDRLFSIHNLGVTHARRVTGSPSMFYAGASFNLRANRSVYEIYDYNGFNAYLRAKWDAPGNLMLVPSYTFNTRSYWNLGDEGYREHNLSLQATKTLSGTTLRGDLAYGLKIHFGTEGQLLVGTQVARSLGPGIGLSVRYQRRLNTQAPSFASEELTYLDEDLLVDRYDYGGHELTSRLTWLFPSGVTLIAEAGRETQNYDGQAALDLDGLPYPTLNDRHDRISFGEVTLELPLTQRIDLGVGYQIESSRSNDAYYDYSRRNRLSLSLDLGF